MSRTDSPPPRKKECAHAAAAELDTDTEALLRKARVVGQVGVIVRLCVAFRPEGELSGEREIAAQRASIARAQEELLKRLAPFKTYRVRRFEYSPLISMVVDADALRHLATSAAVHSITEDISLPPTKE